MQPVQMTAPDLSQRPVAALGAGVLALAAGFAPYSDDVSFVRTLVLPAAGTHTISIRAVDMAGNVAELHDQAFDVVDALPSPSPSPTPAPTPTPRRAPIATPTPIPTAAPTPAPLPAITIAPLQVSSNPPPPPGGTLPPCPATYTVATSITWNFQGPITDGWLEDGQLVKVTELASSTAIVTDLVPVPVPPPGSTAPRVVQNVVLTPQKVESPRVVLDCQGGT